MKKVLVFVFLVIIIVCDILEDSVLLGYDGVVLCIINISDFVIIVLKVIFGGGGSQVFENIVLGVIIVYFFFDFIYSYVYLEVIVEGDILVF